MEKRRALSCVRLFSVKTVNGMVPLFHEFLSVPDVYALFQRTGVGADVASVDAVDAVVDRFS